MIDTRSNRWTPMEDDAFRKMAEANIRPELIAAKLNRSVHAIKARAYANRTPIEMVQAEGEGEVKGWKWAGDLRVQVCIIIALIFVIWIVLQQQYY
jgi:hypothetical protein